MPKLPNKLTAFGLTLDLSWDKIDRPRAKHLECIPNAKQFYLSIPDTVRCLALPEANQVIIDRLDDTITLDTVNAWLLGTVLAYVLQYHGYLVLHGSAVLVNGRAILFSGKSGAGKSTLAHAFVQQGHQFITDDVIVIQYTDGNEPHIQRGPSHAKLWQDTMQHFRHNIGTATPILQKMNKYLMPIQTSQAEAQSFPVAGFYEINRATEQPQVQALKGTEALKTIMENAYRYFMLKPLGKVETFFHQCHLLAQQISVNKLFRVEELSALDELTEYIINFHSVHTRCG